MTDQPFAPHPLTAAGSVELAVVDRSGLDESRHLGVAVVVSPSGEVLEAHGDVSAAIYPRSSLKPLQATAALATGVRLDQEQIALATASHGGTSRHIEVVERTLLGAGLTADHLQCPPDWPLDAASGRDAGEKRRVAMNCSGKHAAFLAACVHAGWSTEDYLDPAHPLQRSIADIVEQHAGEAIAHSGIDGCGAPVHAITPVGMARAASRVANGPSVIASAVRAHPWAIDGPGRDNTVAVENLGVFAKLGAEGYYIAVAQDGTSAAVKVLDGSGRVGSLVALSLLARHSRLDPGALAETLERTAPPMLGGGRPVGSWRLLV
ncbi:asparaginase [Schumannella soli]|uniref:Asparaginase n=1 Tax=Schumannella soli TaxID=2590779 RepID=A0A506Y3K1_9MICO|nr:asparaginase [Schumannella soli]TPW76007.1 asparaginase [Schumannella soli]